MIFNLDYPKILVIDDIDLMVNKTILSHPWHLTTSSFEFRGRNIRNGRLQGATVQQQNGLQQFSTRNSTSTSRRTTTSARHCLQQQARSNDVKQQIRSKDMDSTFSSTTSRWTTRTTTIFEEYSKGPYAQQSR